ncbi:prepilin peptidase [Sphingomicrobium lutaoense]|uniref:Prepilin leader peptidase/N-methyltransferase n=1 Tax=Sphingomicrobium lutaoense TaxID=515949 RepID=A0A839Z5J6_9SPHN|nr:A24 family peptidase [Sphingomicrobium lutaoense]MBB3764892.1 leader peptidase (prepilin peptidase)/N-methyltransferase [Sphingomicrobium lutaoense]
MPLSGLLVAAGGVTGAIVGSYLATLVLRWPRGEGASRGRSACDHCGVTIRPADLVPILSHLLRRGRCRACGQPIDATHFLVEASGAAIGAGAMALSPGVAGAVLALMGWILLPLVILDWRHLWLPDRLVAILAASGLPLAGLANGLPLIDRLIGGAAGFASLWGIAFLYRRWRGREGMGEGDPKLFGALGCWCGWAGLPLVLLGAAAGLLAYALLSGVAGEREREHPLGSALGVAGFLLLAAEASRVVIL